MFSLAVPLGFVTLIGALVLALRLSQAPPRMPPRIARPSPPPACDDDSDDSDDFGLNEVAVPNRASMAVVL